MAPQPQPQLNDATKNAQAPPQRGQSTQADDAKWDEERLERAMDTLQELYIQCRNLRTTIPRLVAPLTVKQPLPEELFREFSASSKTANQEVQNFRKLMTDKETKDVLEYATKSRAEKPENIRPWVITEHSDWYERKASK